MDLREDTHAHRFGPDLECGHCGLHWATWQERGEDCRGADRCSNGHPRPPQRGNQSLDRPRIWQCPECHEYVGPKSMNPKGVCLRGHSYTPENGRWIPKRTRRTGRVEYLSWECRACQNQLAREMRARKRLERSGAHGEIAND